MSTPVPSTPAPSSEKGHPAAAPGSVISADLDEQLLSFWQKYGQTLLIALALVLVAYLVKSGWDYFQAEQEDGVRAQYAAAALPEQLKAFVAAHPTHPLAGVAELQLADQAYLAGQGAEATSDYAEAAAILKSDPLAARAELGQAMAQIQAGQTQEGQAGLQRLANDPQQLAVIRAEAGYQLASLAASAGRADEVQKLAMQVMQADPSSPWTQRVFSLEATMPPAPTPAPAGAAPGVSFKPAKP